MSKRVVLSVMLAAGFSLGMLLSGLPTGVPTAWADYYSNGISAYNAHDYQRAIVSLQKALKENPKNANAAFYLGNAYSHMKDYDSARQAFELVVQTSDPSSPLAAKARNNINYLTKQQITQASNSGKASQVMNTALSSSSADNYLTSVIPSGKIIHFATNRMPLRVYIANGGGIQGWNSDMKQAVRYAMQTWQYAARGRLRFTETFSEDNADIIVRWQRNFSDNLLGVSPFSMVGDTIVRSDINLAVYYPDSNTPIPIEELKGIAVHEMGHAIGLKGHSPYPGDIMFFAKTRKGSSLSQRDVNTIGMLYKLDADVANNSGTSTARTKKYYELYELGLKAQTANRATEAISYYRQAIALSGVLPEAKYNLGALLINEGNKMIRANNLTGAKRNFEEATRLYAEILRNPSSAPEHTQENLDAAKHNLALVTEALNAGQ